jgi:hypothetical protein
MAASTQIEWTDATWNPVTGCTKITRGCDFCYAERFSERFRGVPGHPFENGFDLKLRPERLTQPLAWRQPRRIFVNSMSDLFHKEIPRSFIDSVFDTMEAGDWHTFQVLTKRSSLMTRYLRSRYGTGKAPPHIWLGVSVEDAKNAVRVMSDAKTIASLDPILGGPEWEARLDPTLPRGRAVEKLFRDNLAIAGNFDFVVSTKIDRPTADRPHFFIAYATKSRDGLKTFRETEYNALKLNARDRADAKERKREGRSGSPDLFSSFEADVQETTIDEIVEEQKTLASQEALRILRKLSPISFSNVWELLLQAYMLRVTNVKDICVDLAKVGAIENTWGGGNRKPRDQDVISLKSG